MSEGETSAGIGLVSSHLPPNFSQVPASWSYCRCVMKREIPVWNKSDLHSAGVMICVDWPHSACCQKISFSREISQASKGVSGFSSSPSGQRSSPEIRFTGTSSSSSSVVGSTRGPGGAGFYLPRGAHTGPRRETGAQPAFGKLIIRGATDDTSENEILREARTLVPPFTC